HVLVDVGVVGDLVGPRLIPLGRRQVAVEQQVGHLEVGRLLGQLLDGVAAVLEDAGIAVDVGDGTAGEGRRHQGLVVEPDPGQDAAPGGGVDAPVHDGHVDRLPRAVVGDRY